MLVNGGQVDTEELREDVAQLPAPTGSRLLAAKTRGSHIVEGLDFLGFRIQRRREPGTTHALF